MTPVEVWSPVITLKANPSQSESEHTKPVIYQIYQAFSVLTIIYKHIHMSVGLGFILIAFRVTWWATVHEVAKSWTRLSD